MTTSRCHGTSESLKLDWKKCIKNTHAYSSYSSLVVREDRNSVDVKTSFAFYVKQIRDYLVNQSDLNMT